MERIEEKKENIEPESIKRESIQSDSLIEEQEPKIESEIENPSEILDKEEEALPEPQSSELKFPSPSVIQKTRTKKCPPGCMNKSRCKKGVKGGKGSKKTKKSKKSTSKKQRNMKKSKK